MSLIDDAANMDHEETGKGARLTAQIDAASPQHELLRRAAARIESVELIIAGLKRKSGNSPSRSLVILAYLGAAAA